MGAVRAVGGGVCRCGAAWVCLRGVCVGCWGRAGSCIEGFLMCGLRHHVGPRPIFCEVVPETQEDSRQAVTGAVLLSGLTGSVSVCGGHSPLGPAFGELFRCQANQYLWVRKHL